MEKSYKFKHIENNLLKLLDVIVNHQPILKYIYYLDDDPLSHSDVEVDLIESGHIVLSPFDPNILNQSMVKVFLNPFEGNLNLMPLSDITFLLDIVVPAKKWLLHGLGQIRAFRIADELAQLIDGQMVAGIGECKITRFKLFKVNNEFSGLTLWIRVNSSTMKGLRKN